MTTKLDPRLIPAQNLTDSSPTTGTAGRRSSHENVLPVGEEAAAAAAARPASTGAGVESGAGVEPTGSVAPCVADATGAIAAGAAGEAAASGVTGICPGPQRVKPPRRTPR